MNDGGISQEMSTGAGWFLLEMLRLQAVVT